MLNKFNNQVFKYNSTKQNESLLHSQYFKQLYESFWNPDYKAYKFNGRVYVGSYNL